MGKRDIKADSELINVAKHMRKMGMTPNEFIQTYSDDYVSRQVLAKHLFRLKLTTFPDYDDPDYAIYWE